MRPELQTPAPGAAPTSPRVRLARLALEAALGLPEVLAGEVGPQSLRVTADAGGGLLRGVSVTAEGEGRYSVDLRLVSQVVPLVPLAEEIQRRVRASARSEGLTDRLGVVNVEFGRLMTAEDVLLEAEAEAEADADAARPADAPPPVVPAAPQPGVDR